MRVAWKPYDLHDRRSGNHGFRAPAVPRAAAKPGLRTSTAVPIGSRNMTREDTMIKGLNHVGLSVANLDRQIAFYRDGLGLEVVEDETFGGPQYGTILSLPGATGRMVLLKGPTLQLELFEFSHPEPKPSEPNRSV